MASWPGTLPQEMRLPISHTQEDATLRTKMDAGPKKVRRRYSAVEQPFSQAMLMDGQQYQDLWDFYNNTLAGGSLRFDWENPKDDSTVEMRFVEPPKGDLRAGGSATERTWFVTMKLEIMP